MSHSNGEELFTLAVFLAIAFLYAYRPSWKGSGTAHGTATWATKQHLQKAGFLSEDGLILGRTLEGNQLLRIPRYCHLAIFAPAGAGKGVSLAIPWLLDYVRGSVIVNDPKGELFRATSEVRRALGNTIIRLDPYGVCGPGTDTFNVFDLLSSDENAIDDARALSEALVIRTGNESDPHWNDQAAAVLTVLTTCALIQFSGEERSIGAVRQFLTEEKTFNSAVSDLENAGGIFARMAGVLSQLKDKEKSGVLSTCNRHTAFLDSPAVDRVTGKSSFSAEALLEGNMTVYLILPPAMLQAQSRWLRMVIAAFTRLIGKHGMRNGSECLMLLDEAGQLGHMDAVEQAVTLLRSYGLRMMFFFQSLGQLKECFKDKESVLLDNTEHLYFGVQSYETAERVSKMLGDATIVLESANENESRSWQEGGMQHDPGTNVNHSSGRNYSEHGRALLRPEEVLQLHGDLLIAVLRGVPPVLTKRIKWYEDTLFFSGGRSLPEMPRALLWAGLFAATAGVVWLLVNLK